MLELQVNIQLVYYMHFILYQQKHLFMLYNKSIVTSIMSYIKIYFHIVLLSKYYTLGVCVMLAILAEFKWLIYYLHGISHKTFLSMNKSLIFVCK